MIPTWKSNRPIQRPTSRGHAFRIIVALSIGAMVLAGSFARSFEPVPQDQGAPSAKSEADQPKSGANEAASKKPSAARKEKRADSASAGSDEAKMPLPARPVKTVTPPTLTSAELDRLIAQHLASTDPKVEPAPRTSDVEFVRRIYFDLIGRPPTPEQVHAFGRDRSKEKRAQLIDTLLNSREYARNWGRYWRDVIKFHSTSENPARVRFDALADWLAKQFQANKPWDEICSAMITATGRNDENSAVAFPMAYEAQPVEMAGEVSRIFLGVQIQCAQCHDHKTDAWKQRQFHEFAAFFAGARPRQVVKASPGEPPVIEVVAQGPRRYTMPDKDNPKKQVPIAPRFFLSSSKSKPEPALPETIGVPERRALAASYVTGQDNPWFAKAFINRIWYSLMGETFYEPIDDIGPERTAKGPEVLDPLADQWRKGGYDIRWLFRTILNTEAYQRRVRSTASAAGKTPFASNCPSRLRADQVFDALVQALALPLDANGNLINPNPNGRGPGQGQGKNAKKAQANLSLGDPKRAQNPALTKGSLKKAAEATGLAAQVAKKQGNVQRPGGPRLLFDRLFGVDPSIPNEDVVGTIPQALFLMNSPLVNNRTQARPATVLGEVLSTTNDDRAALGALYLRILSRQPTAAEVEICGRYLASVGDRREAFEDIYWSLINTTEFLTRR
jgi:Protein of unknown function (DUF1549)/Protein of unknown function (DUF1553)